MNDTRQNEYGVVFKALSEREFNESMLCQLNFAKQQQHVWVFAYGSLMWKTEFSYHQRYLAKLEGYTRQFHIWSLVGRGTPTQPGLGLCIERGPGNPCLGYVYRLDKNTLEHDFEVLWQREMTSGVYQPQWLDVEICDKSATENIIKALTFVVDRHHPHYAGQMNIKKMAAIMSKASGKFGTNKDYLFNMVQSMVMIGLREPTFVDLLNEIRKIEADSGKP